MPSLTEGFIQIANQLPNDPLNFLVFKLYLLNILG